MRHLEYAELSWRRPQELPNRTLPRPGAHSVRHLIDRPTLHVVEVPGGVGRGPELGDSSTGHAGAECGTTECGGKSLVMQGFLGFGCWLGDEWSVAVFSRQEYEQRRTGWEMI